MNSKVKTPQGPNGKIVAVQVLPVIQNNDDFTAQPEGATEETNGYSLYVRFQNGEVTWVADVNMFAPEMAIKFALVLAQEHQVQVESNAFTKKHNVPELQFAHVETTVGN